MSKKLFVGNLDYAVAEGDLKEVFAQYGEVQSIKIIRDFNTGRSKGFAFVEMSSADEIAQCISQLNGSDLNGRPIKVSEAREQQQRTGGGGGGRGGRGGFGGGGGYGGGGGRGGSGGGGGRGGRDRY